MLDLKIVAVGKAAPKSAEAQLIEDYLGRAGATGKALGFRVPTPAIIDVPKISSDSQRLAVEAEKLQDHLGRGTSIVALDERAPPWKSVPMADKLAGWRDEGLSEVAFLIGGPDGYAEPLRTALRGRQAILRSFGEATWPHLMVRVMLAEQLYRAMTILAGHPYHRA